jgi:hypothetical protein
MRSLNPVNQQDREDLLNMDTIGDYHGPTIDELILAEDLDRQANQPIDRWDYLLAQADMERDEQ